MKADGEVDHLLCLGAVELEQLELSMLDMVGILESMFRARATERMLNPPKIFAHRAEARFYSAMVGVAPGLGFASCKWQSGDAENPARGLPMIQGLLLLSEDASGRPVALMDSKWITGNRTAAASALLARHQARSGAETLGILGCGVQGRKHLEAMAAAVPTLRRCVAFDIVPERAAAYVSDMSERYDLQIAAMDDAEDCAMQADILVSGAPIVAHPKPVIAPDWVKPGSLGISIDYDASWRPETVAAMDLVLTDDRDQLADEQRKGHFEGVEHIDADIAEMLHAGRALRSSDEQRILGFNLGIALEDLAVAAELYRRARQRGIGTRLKL